jgi:hypothetical protein
MQIDIFDSAGWGGEKTTRLLSKKNGVYRPNVIVHAGCHLQPGDIVTVMGQVECSNEFSWKRRSCGCKTAKNSMLGSNIFISRNSGATSGHPIGFPQTQNITTAQHHGFNTPHGMLKIPSSWTPATYWFNLVAWSSNGLKVNQGYARVFVERKRP